MLGFAVALTTGLVLPLTGALAWWIAIPLGLVAWAVLAKVLGTRRPGREFADHKHLLVDARLLSNQLHDAEARIGRIRRVAFSLRHRAISRRLKEITDAARAMIKEVRADPNDFPRVEKALTSYLAHVETMALSLKTIRKVSEADPQTLQRMETTLADTATAMRAYREKLIADDRLELDVRMDLVERSLARDLDRIERRT